MPKVFKWDNKPISRAGAYHGVPIEAYHSGKLCDGLSTSTTGVKRMLRSPAHHWAHSPLNPECAPRKRKKELDTGAAAHTRVFEPEKFAASYWISNFPDFRTDAAKLARDVALSDGKIVLSAEDFALVARMAEVIRKDQLALSLFADGMPELTYAAKDEATGIWLLTRPDFLPAQIGRGPSDYKTTVSAEPAKWGRQAFDLYYHVQVALALDVLEKVEHERRPTFWMVAQEKEEPYVVECFRWEPDQIEMGEVDLRAGLDRLAFCWEAHNSDDELIRASAWPNYTGGRPTSVVTPNYLQRRLDAGY